MDMIEEYIQSQDVEIQPKLNQICEVIREAIPDAEERISYKMPTYWKGRNIVHFAAFKDHIGIYPGGEATTEFAERLTEYRTSKGTIQLPYDRELPLDLIRDIVKWCYKKYAN